MKNNKLFKRFIDYMRRTMANKIVSSFLITLAIVIARFSGDGTFLVFACIIGIPTFFINENVVIF